MPWSMADLCNKAHRNEHGAQQFLGDNAEAPAFDVGGIHLAKHLAHVRQGFVDHHADYSQGVVYGHEIIEIAHRERVFKALA